jgi:hypothetical protein
MPLTESTVTRAVDASGDPIKTFLDGADHVQGAALVDDNGDHAGIETIPLVVRPKRLTWSGSSSSLETSRQVSAGAGHLHEVRCLLDPTVTADRYLHVFIDVASVSGGETPAWRAFIPAGGEASDSFKGGLPFTTGCVVAVSTTLATLTLPGAGEAMFQFGSE